MYLLVTEPFMTHECSDSHLGKAEIVGDAREAMTKDVRCHIGQWRVLKDVLPMVRKTAERVVLALRWEDVCADIIGAPPLEVFDDWQPYGADGFTLLAVLQPQATRLGVRFRPFQARSSRCGGSRSAQAGERSPRS